MKLLKNLKKLYRKVRGQTTLQTTLPTLPKLFPVKMVGVKTYDPRTGDLIDSDPDHMEAVSCMMRYQGEVIEPLPTDTAEDIASFMSCAACDHEFPRVIVYPIDYDLRIQVEQLLLENKDNLYPMYEYREANIISDEKLNSKTLLYKYAGKTHNAKPI